MEMTLEEKQAQRIHNLEHALFTIYNNTLPQRTLLTYEQLRFIINMIQKVVTEPQLGIADLRKRTTDE